MLEIEFATDNASAGFRLEKLEVFNWGTFNAQVWEINPSGFNSLLTGDIGSGKSTMVDALTTLLVPHHKITYNRAAGAETRERTLKSYILGEYKSEKAEFSQAAKPVYLRDDRTVSILLARFGNEGLQQTVCIAQVFWLAEGQAKKFFVVANRTITIPEIHALDTDLPGIKKKLRALENVEVYDQFNDYNKHFRRAFGIASEKALDMFYQTVSMKSVGNLTGFVRQQMLEATDAKERVHNLKDNFDNLTKAYEQVQRAKRQLDQLQPLLSDADSYEQFEQEWQVLDQSVEAVAVWFAEKKTSLLKAEITSLGRQLEELNSQLSELKVQLTSLREQETGLKAAIQSSEEGKRLEYIQKEVERLGTQMDEQHTKAQQYARWAKEVGIPMPGTEREFFDQRERATGLQEEFRQSKEQLRSEEIDFSLELNKVEGSLAEDEKELESLRERQSQLPVRVINMRQEMLNVLRLSEDDLPFAGELLQVREGEHAWEGAVERVLHNFALSLLVPEHHYQEVSHYVNRTKLKIVYYKTSERQQQTQQPLPSDSLVYKVSIKPDTPLHHWMEGELETRFNLVCCDRLSDFQNERFALTKEGQVKRGGRKHEKDDSYDINDRRRYILGWDNAAKVRAIEVAMEKLQKTREGLLKQRERNRSGQEDLERKLNALHDLLQLEQYKLIDWNKTVLEIQKLEEERQAIENSSDKLKTLKQKLEHITQNIKAKEEEREKISNKEGRLTERQQGFEKELSSASVIADHMTVEEKEEYYPKLSNFFPSMPTTIENCNQQQEKTNASIRGRQSNVRRGSNESSQRMISKMQRFKGDFPAETTEMDASVHSIREFRELTERIERDQLPEFEAKFRELLKEKTIQDILIFQNKLDEYQKAITGKIVQINESLRNIEYNRGTFIELNADAVNDSDIQSFRRQLRECLSETAGAVDEVYTEAKFLQVKAILDRFSSGEKVDVQWSERVTDVRNWFTYSATEKFLETNETKEYYTDSSGKSGGQKEKLAYTILASALAYHFGLALNEPRSRSFRFVVIDEAFGRGSDESTRYGLDLFKKLDLQLLIVTPLQKINIIEDYISAVHYVSNKEGNRSVVRDLTIEQYQKEKRDFLSVATGGIVNQDYPNRNG